MYFTFSKRLFCLVLSLGLVGCNDSNEKESEGSHSNTNEVSVLTVSNEVSKESIKPVAEAPIQQPSQIALVNVFSSSEEVHNYIKKFNSSYNGRGQFQLTPDKKIFAAAFPESGLSDLSFLKEWPLESLDLMANPVSDLSPLKDKKSLKALYLERTNVSDLTPIYGLPIQSLYINNTRIKDLRPLIDMPLVEFNAVGTGVTDILPLARSSLRILWLSETAVSDISPLIACPLESLTLHRTPITDLKPLASTSLKRLHIGETNVSDLRPILRLPLSRLIFSPERIEFGLEEVKQMPFLNEIGTSFDTRMPPAQFWDTWKK